jgi:hypothetical protein
MIKDTSKLFNNYFNNINPKLKLKNSTIIIIILLILIGISASIVYTSKQPEIIEETEMNENKGQRVAGTIISFITSILFVIFISLFIFSHTYDKNFKDNKPLIVSYIFKIFFILFMWIAFYIFPIINYNKYGWKPLVNNPPKDTSEYRAYFGFRIFMNILIICLGTYCTLRFLGIISSKNVYDDFTIAYIVVSIAMFAAVVNLANAAGYASDEDVILSS